jgi:hypothetical protein
MYNPIDIEFRYRNLILSFSKPTTHCERLVHVKSFLEQVQQYPVEAESYIIDLIQHLHRLLPDRDVVGCEPASMYYIYDSLMNMGNSRTSIRSTELYTETLDFLRLNIALLYAYVGDFRRMLSILYTKTDNSEYTLPDKFRLEMNVTPFTYDRIKLLHSLLVHEKSDITEAVGRIISEWDRRMIINYTAVNIPVVERYADGMDVVEGTGGIRRISIRIFRESAKNRDEIDTDVSFYASGQLSNFGPTDPIKAARRLLAETHPLLKNKFVVARIKFEDPHVPHSGSSVNLAIAALFYCTVLHFNDQRVQVRISPRAALTGDINEMGDIISVDENGLRQKVRSVMVSWLDYLVVPKDQIHIAEEEYRKSKQMYPDRSIEIIGAAHLRDLFYDRRITERRRFGVIRHLGRKIWHKRAIIVPACIILALLLFSLKLIYGPIDKNPVMGEYVGEKIFIKNKYEQILDEIWVGKYTVDHLSDSEVDGIIRYQRVLFADITGNGINEIIWAQQPESENNHISYVYCKSLKDNAILWSFPVSKELSFPFKPDVKSDQFIVRTLAINTNSRGETSLYVVAVHYFFPSILYKIDPKTGEEIGHYLHVGHITDIRFADLDGNGNDVILITGINNSLRNAFFAVLDQDLISGHSPITGDYGVDRYAPGTEIAYILIPFTIIGESLREYVQYNMSYLIRVDQTNKLISISTRDIGGVNPFPDGNFAGYSVSLGFDLKIRGVGTGDDYDALAERLYANGTISRLPDYKYFEEYITTFRYWDGYDWHNEPVYNKHYLEKLNAK